MPRRLQLDPGLALAGDEPDACSGSGRCCHNHSVLITASDARRLAACVPAFAASPEAYIVLFTLREGYDDADILARFPALVVDGDPCYPALRFVEVAPGLRRCPFLDAGLGKCTVHDVKPMACRAYPFVVDGDVIARVDRPRCRRPYHPRSPPDVDALVTLMEAALAELEAHACFARAWNGDGSGGAARRFTRLFLNVK